MEPFLQFQGTWRTYQALRGAMTRYAGTIKETDAADTDDNGSAEQKTEQEDFAGNVNPPRLGVLFV